MVATTVHSTTTAPGGAGRIAARLVLGVGVACAAVELLAGPAYRFGLLPLGFALQALRWAATVAVGGALVALVVLVWATVRAARPSSRAVAALALLINLLAAAPPLYMVMRLQQLPKIHDITTDTDNPPTFDAVVPRRKGARNAIDYVAATASEQHRGYPDIAPLALPLAPPIAFERSVRAARALGWDIVDAAPDKLRLEATATTLLFGFKDDIVVRITPRDGGSLIDMRSLSRVGGSDFGANADRVRAFLKRLADGVDAPP